MKQFTIEENDANQRLDKFLKKLFPSATRSLIYKLNRKGNIKINGKKQDNEYKLQIGEEIKIFVSDDDFIKMSAPPLNPLLDKEGKVSEANRGGIDKKDIVFEDVGLLVVNKNPGMNVHPGDHKTKELSLIALVQDYFSGKLDSLTFKPSLVHRIDRDTSGIIMIAKKKNVLDSMLSQLQNNKIKKTYFTLVFGKLPAKSGTINKRLKRIEGATKEDKVQVADDGQVAITHYKVIDEKKAGDLIISSVEVTIETGRMHQIRVHMASMGTPVVGDDKYGDKKLNSFIKRNYGLARQALHSWKTEFINPSSNKEIKLEARLKEDLTKFLNSL
ncbi:MAG: RluA family pseudouridine synthase [Candidatus Gracilibacteria bacterium]|nr:RluA family pseudouridine synthase [Candidatus Gracilibacteria bacterium]